MSKDPSAKQAFEQGDYRAARSLATATLHNVDASKKAKDGAQQILQKTSPPSLAKYMFLLAAVLMVLLSVFWMSEGKKHRDEPSGAGAGQDSPTPRPSQSVP